MVKDGDGSRRKKTGLDVEIKGVGWGRNRDARLWNEWEKEVLEADDNDILWGKDKKKMEN